MTFKIGTQLLIVVMLVSRPLFAEQMTIDKQIKLSPGHRVMPYHIERSSDGDLLVFGSNSQLDNRPWAMRVSPTGQVRWEFLQGGGDGWNDQSEKGQQFNSVIEFQDRTTLLCGTKVTNNRASVLLDHLSVDGRLIDERTIRPEAGHGLLSSASCVWWNNGVTLIGAVSGQPGTGWLATLNTHLDVDKQRFGDLYIGTDFIHTQDGGLFYLNGFLRDAEGRRVTSVMKLGATDQPTALYAFGPNEAVSFVFPVVMRPELTFNFSEDLDSRIVQLDAHFRGLNHVIKLHNAGGKKSLMLPDGSIAIFGSQYHNGATAAVTRVYQNGSSQGFVAQPPFQSAFYIDAVYLDGKNDFAATRLGADSQAILDWVSFE